MTVVLKAGKEKPILNKHHWIFSGAISKLPSFADGDILGVTSASGTFLGSAYFNRKAGIMGRMITFDQEEPVEAIKKKLNESIDFRKQIFQNNLTDSYRLVNGEGDCLPGLIVDKYGETLVLQISTLGMEKLKSKIIEWLVSKLSPKTIYEKSELPSRKEEGLPNFSGFLYGPQVGEVEIKENGLKFAVNIVEGQKTGFFFDHREMRQKIRGLAKGKSVLNCFAYTGGFTVYALAGGATKVDTVEISEQAIAQAKQNTALNGFAVVESSFQAVDVFEFLRKEKLDYEVVILDPPAFAKRQKDVIPACRGYKDINRLAMQKMPKGSWLLTCSCSYHVDDTLFQKVVFQASVEANRTVRIVGRHNLAPDHPINICHPETDYLKSLLLYVE